MQSYKFEEVIDKTCEKKNLNKDLLKSISGFVWKETKEEMFRFSNLRIYLSGFVAWYYGFSRLKIAKDKIDLKLNAPDRIVEKKKRITFMEQMTDEEFDTTAERVNALLDLYPVYIEDKNTTKAQYREDMKILIEQRLNKPTNDIIS